MRLNRLTLVSFVSLLLVIAWVAQGQGSCPALVEQAVSAMAPQSLSLTGPSPQGKEPCEDT